MSLYTEHVKSDQSFVRKISFVQSKVTYALLVDTNIQNFTLTDTINFIFTANNVSFFR
jgi:hypothetical protein